MGMALGIEFSWIFVDFGGQVGAKLALKIDQKSIQKGIKKMMRKESVPRSSRARFVEFSSFLVGGAKGVAWRWGVHGTP